MNYKDAIASRRIMKILDIRNIEYGLYLDVREKFISLKQGFITTELRKKSLAEFASIIKPMIDDLMEHDLRSGRLYRRGKETLQPMNCTLYTMRCV